MVEIRRLKDPDDRRRVPQLAGILLDCVVGGASVSFMANLTFAEAEAFFERTYEDAVRGNRILLAAWDGADLIGTVQLITSLPPNQPHRAEVAKLLVKPSARGQGVAGLLMTEIEEVARQAGKSLLTLDTVTGGDAERLYTKLGWSKTGVIPDYAFMPDGTPCSTTIFWKKV